MIELNLRDYNELKEKLEKLSDVQIRDALTSSALLVSNEAKILCPVDTGRLRSSISYEIYDDYALVGSNVDYAPYIENGTGLFSATGDGRQDRWSYQSADGEWHSTLGQKPQPFLGPALNNNRQRIINLFEQEVALK